MPEFEWDEDKRLTNVTKHQIDFADARALFDGRPVVVTDTRVEGELRFKTIGELDGRL
ncbi:MAG: BrnT family toxin [Chloroflexota bacterium]|nr:BrnT family toxin [Chloroflexota bacterium]